MVVVNDFDGASSINEVPLNFVWIWVQIHGIPPAFLTMATIALIGETLGPVLTVDQRGVREGLARVRVALPLHKPIRLEKKVLFSSTEEYGLTFKYDHLLGQCKLCARLDHMGAPCLDIVPSGIPGSAGPSSSLVSGVTTPSLMFRANIPQTLSSSLFSNVCFYEVFPKEKRGVVIKPVPIIQTVAVLEPLCIMGVVREREVEEEQTTKWSCHALVIEPSVLQHENLGFEQTDAGLLEVSITTARVNKCSRGRPRVSVNKPKEELSAPCSLLSRLFYICFFR